MNTQVITQTDNFIHPRKVPSQVINKHKQLLARIKNVLGFFALQLGQGVLSERYPTHVPRVDCDVTADSPFPQLPQNSLCLPQPQPGTKPRSAAATCRCRPFFSAAVAADSKKTHGSAQVIKSSSIMRLSNSDVDIGADTILPLQ
jgi:hypothetical protein